MTAVVETETLYVVRELPPIDALVEKLTINLLMKRREKDIPRREEALRNDFDLYQRYAALARTEGITVSEINKGLGIHTTRTKQFREGSIPRSINVVISRTDDDRSIVPNEKAIGFAYLLGFFVSMCDKKRKGQKNRYMKNFETNNPELRSRIKKICDQLNIPCKVNNQFTILGPCKAVKYLYDITETGARVPWEHLVTQEERREFLAGYFERGGTITHNSTRYGFNADLCVTEVESKELVSDILVMLSEQKIYPTINERMNGIDIRGRLELEEIYTLLHSKQRKQSIRKTLDQDHRQEVWKIQDCIEVETYKKDHPLNSPKHIFSRLGFDLSRILGITTQALRRIRNYRRIKDLISNRPDHNVIGYCFRECGVSSEAARALAGVYRIDEIEKYEQKEIQSWAKRYDKDPDVEINLKAVPEIIDPVVLRRRTINTLCYLAALSVRTKETTGLEADKYLKELAKHEDHPYDKLRRMYRRHLKRLYRQDRSEE